MTVAYETYRGLPHPSQHLVCLDDKFEVLKDIGDGSFGSVALARVRSAGAYLAKRGTLVAIKTMKKSFDNFAQCQELREVIFLKSLPSHPHLVPALDIFLDPISKRLHIAMEYMDGNLYQLMKARDHKRLDSASVKTILFQIMSGLEHIHEHSFFHRDIKPENILVSTSSPQDSSNAFRRYSALATPPSTPPAYTIKIADFGLARETHSKLPYTTYVSTRWYRAPEVLLRAGEYSAPVDIWAIGAMAVEIATLKPLFPGGNEVDQVWRVCDIMGSPGSWVNKHGVRVGGGEWKDGVRLAQKLGFSFPKMAPHSMDSILQAPEWPASLANFVTWCLMWDPKCRPTSSQALAHEYFADAVDPLRPKSSASRFLASKQSDLSGGTLKDPTEANPTLSSKTSSWFRKSLVARESAPAVPQHVAAVRPLSPRPSPIHSNSTGMDATAPAKIRPSANKRSTWTNGLPSNAAPIPILPSIRPISPLSDAVTAQASVRTTEAENATKKIGRQLSVASNGNHYTDFHRQEAERALTGQRESFFSHLRKRARRLSGRNQAPLSPNSDDIEANAGCAPWVSNRQSIIADPPSAVRSPRQSELADLDRAIQNVRYSLDASSQASNAQTVLKSKASNPLLKRHHSLPCGQEPHPNENSAAGLTTGGPISSRTRRAIQKQAMPTHRYETPDEEDELLDEALTSAHQAVKRLDSHAQRQAATQQDASAVQCRPSMQHFATDLGPSMAYLTPSSSANCNGVKFGLDGHYVPSQPVIIVKPRDARQDLQPKWPTPPYEEHEWAASVIQAAWR